MAALIQKDVPVLTRADPAHPGAEAEKRGGQHQRDAHLQHSTFVSLPQLVLPLGINAPKKWLEVVAFAAEHRAKLVLLT